MSKNRGLMNKQIFKINLLILLSFFSMQASSPYTVLPCTIEFPQSVEKVPQICVYQSGERFTCEIDHEGKRACFILPADKLCTTFHLVITDGLSFEAQDNTVQCLKINPKHSYKFYEMELIKATQKQTSPDKKKQNTDHWIVTEHKLVDGKIPDEAIIVLLNANYIQHLRADRGFELPAIVVKKNVLSIAGSEKKLQDKAIELLLTSLDYNPLHETIKAHTKQDKQKVIIAMTNM